MATLTVRKLGYALGAEVTGVDLSKPIDDRTVAELRRLWIENIVLCFPRQELDAVKLAAFCSRFGELNQHPVPSTHHPEHQNVILVVNKPITVGGKAFTGGIGDEWHSDQQYTVKPPSGSFLFAQELPDVGGNTMFANMYLAYETLSPAMRAMIDPLQSVHDVSISEHFSRYAPEKQAQVRAENPPVVHPLVRVHRESGRKGLYVGSRLRNFVGMTPEESRPLRDFLNEHATRYEFTYRHRWSVHDLVVWDNRCAMHRAIADYDRSQLRRLIRCELREPASGRLESEPALSVA